MQEGLGIRQEVELDPELSGQRFEHTLDLEEARRSLLAPPTGSHQRSDREGGDGVRLECRRWSLTGESAAQDPARRRLAAGEVGPASLREGDAVGAAREVVPGGVQ